MRWTKPERAMVLCTVLALILTSGYFLYLGSEEVMVSFSHLQWESESVLWTDAAGEEQPEEASIQAPAGPLLDVNSATLEELDCLPGIGPARAQAIVDYRTKHGPFARIEDLCAVEGIGEGTLERIRAYIIVGEQYHG